MQPLSLVSRRKNSPIPEPPAAPVGGYVTFHSEVALEIKHQTLIGEPRRLS